MNTLLADKFLLSQLGITLNTFNGTLQALPSEHSKLFQLENGSIAYGSKEYYYLVLYEDLLQVNLELNDEVTQDVNGKVYTFGITNILIDTTGWCKLMASLKSIV